MATHSRILAWRISWTEEPGRLQSMGLQRAGHDQEEHMCFTWISCSGNGKLPEFHNLSYQLCRKDARESAASFRTLS